METHSQPGAVGSAPSHQARQLRGGGSATQFAILAVLLAAILAVLVVDTLGKAPSPTWEYTVEPVPDLSFRATMEQLGEDGWELVFARRASDADGDMLYECIFKRRT